MKVLPTYPPGLRLKLATCGLLGRGDEGRTYVKWLLAVHPKCSIAWLQDSWGPLMRRNPGFIAKYIEGARVAGLPERPRSE
jgi:hypothetical protein